VKDIKRLDPQLNQGSNSSSLFCHTPSCLSPMEPDASVFRDCILAYQTLESPSTEIFEP
jgi:hypothetical protein